MRPLLYCCATESATAAAAAAMNDGSTSPMLNLLLRIRHVEGTVGYRAQQRHGEEGGADDNGRAVRVKASVRLRHRWTNNLSDNEYLDRQIRFDSFVLQINELGK